MLKSPKKYISWLCIFSLDIVQSHIVLHLVWFWGISEVVHLGEETQWASHLQILHHLQCFPLSHFWKRKKVMNVHELMAISKWCRCLLEGDIIVWQLFNRCTHLLSPPILFLTIWLAWEKEGALLIDQFPKLKNQEYVVKRSSCRWPALPRVRSSMWNSWFFPLLAPRAKDSFYKNCFPFCQTKAAAFEANWYSHAKDLFLFYSKPLLLCVIVTLRREDMVGWTNGTSHAAVIVKITAKKHQKNV